MPIKTGNVAGGLVGVRVAERRTIEGKQCRLPVVYQCVPSIFSSTPLSPEESAICHAQGCVTLTKIHIN